MQQLIINNLWVVGPFIVWSLFWKGWSLWLAARNGSKPWFVVLLIINTLGLLEIIYIFGVSKTKKAPAAPRTI